jgi:hypothetical protein
MLLSCRQPIGGVAVIASRSSSRVVMPSLGKMRYRCVAMVRCER